MAVKRGHVLMHRILRLCLSIVALGAFGLEARSQDEAGRGEAVEPPDATGAEAASDTASSMADGKDSSKSHADTPPLVHPTTGELVLKRVLEHLDDLYRAESSISTMTLTVFKPRRTRKLTMKAWTLGKEKALIVIEAPAREKGTATLRIGKNLWNYMPNIARTIRIPPSMMLSSWMGSDFTNDDLVRESSLLDDFDAEVTSRSTDPEGWIVDLRAKEGTVGLWDRIEYVVTPDGTLPLEARYYDRRGRLARVMTFSDVREFDGRAVPTRMEMAPADKEGYKTVLVYDELDFGADVPESLFTLSTLEQHR
ncbi:MAG: outer membrane lipoprotein-sorting protein [Verrucomicrobia bacterium]|nr:outer membrane lipoprotein-sorting protein [Verrucomicrobiota bacterium]